MGPRGQGASPSASPGTPASTPCCREGRLLLAAAAVALRDRRLLGAAPARAARARRVVSPSRASARPPRTSRSTTSATTPTRTAGSSMRSRKRPGVVVLHEYVLHHLIAGITIGRGDGRGYLDAMERELGVAGRLLGLGVLDNLLPLLWETQPERFPLAGVVLDQAAGLIVHSRLRRRARARGRLRGPALADPAPGVAAGRRRRRRPTSTGDPLIGCFGYPEHEQADPAAARGVRRRCAGARPGARLLLVGAAGERFDIDRRLERLGLTEGVEPPRLRPRGAHVVADGRLRRARQPPLSDDGGDVGLGDPRALARQAAARLRRRLVLRAARRRRAEGAGRRATRSRRSTAALELAADARRGARRGRARVRRARARRGCGRRRVRRGARGRGRRRCGRRRGALADRRGRGRGRSDRHVRCSRDRLREVGIGA